MHSYMIVGIKSSLKGREHLARLGFTLGQIITEVGAEHDLIIYNIEPDTKVSITQDLVNMLQLEVYG